MYDWWLQLASLGLGSGGRERQDKGEHRRTFSLPGRSHGKQERQREAGAARAKEQQQQQTQQQSQESGGRCQNI